ncbi:MAG: hypothetical protein R3E96_08275 [Planctomycetota bacterium]
MTEIAGHCSLRAELAEMAEVAVGDLKTRQFMEPHIGARLMARSCAKPRWRYRGLTCPISTSTASCPAHRNRTKLKGPTLTVQANGSLSFTEGFPIAVRITDVDFLKLQVLMELA